MDGRSTMSRHDPLYVWTKELTTIFPDLSKPQLKGLAEWTFGMILARCCSLDSVTSYMADWLELLQAMRGVVPANWLVVALADRGLWARWLFQEIQLLGWHPLMRVNSGGHFRPDGARRFVPVKQMVPEVGMSWRGRGTAFSTSGRQLVGTLLGWWGPEYREPWLLLSDLAPQR